MDTYAQVGQNVDARLLRVDMEWGRVHLSIRQGTPPPQGQALDPTLPLEEAAPVEAPDLRPELGNMAQVLRV